MFIIGLVTGAASAAIGLPGAFAFAVLAGLFDIFLSVGPLIVTVIAGIVAFVAGSTYLPLSNFWFMVLVVAVYSAIQLFENAWLRPRPLALSRSGPGPVPAPGALARPGPSSR